MKRRDFLKAGVLAAMSSAAKPASANISLSGPIETGICAGETVPLTYTLTKGPGQALLTTFSVSGLPSGITGTFSPASCKGGCGTTLTLRAADSYVLGDYSFIVRAQNSKGVAMANTNIKPRCAVAVQPPPSGNPYEDILANRIGYGANTTGGAGGTIYHVTNLNDSGAGSLRAALESTNTYWIVFDVSGTITLSTPIAVKSNKTIDGRGADITLDGNALVLGTWGTDGGITDNIIINNIKYGADVSYAFRIGMTSKSSNIWINHCTIDTSTVDVEGLFTGSNGVDHANPPHSVTVSWCKWTQTGGNLAHGSWLVSDSTTPEDTVTTITEHHCWLVDINVRQPLMRNATFHSFNNWRDGGDVGVQVFVNGNFRSDNDIFERKFGGLAARVEIVTSEGAVGNVAVNGEYLIGAGAIVEENNPGSIFSPPYSYSAETANDALIASIEASAGWQDIPLPS